MASHLLCKSCKCKYNTTTKKPMVNISCCHTTCLKCMSNIERDAYVICFHCKEGVYDMKPNYALLELPDIIQNHEHVKTLFERGSVTGKYFQFDRAFDMHFDKFSLVKGKLTAKGSDEVGSFTMLGDYDADGNVSFLKQYIDAHSVDYYGSLTHDASDKFEIKGNWLISIVHDRFEITGSKI